MVGAGLQVALVFLGGAARCEAQPMGELRGWGMGRALVKEKLIGQIWVRAELHGTNTSESGRDHLVDWFEGRSNSECKGEAYSGLRAAGYQLGRKKGSEGLGI